MNPTFSLFFKVFLLSAAIAGMIKYLAPLLPIPATPTNALIGVITPTLVMLALLFWRMSYPRSTPPHQAGDR